jgi:FkbM family methyltransferase
MTFFHRDAYSMLTRSLDPSRAHVFVDVGANVGASASRMLAEFPKATVHAFEPCSRVYDQLAARAATVPRLTAHRLAVGDREGEVELHVAANYNFTSTLPPNERGKAYYGEWMRTIDTERVECVTLDRWASRHAIDRIDFLKVDVQGGELGVLRGASGLLERGVTALFCEAQLRPEYEGAATLADIDLFVRRFGLEMHQVHEIYVKGREEQSSVCDVLWLHRDALALLRVNAERGYQADWVQRMRAALDDCAARGCRSVAIVGAGRHTRAVSDAFIDPPVEIACIVDDDRSIQGTRMWGLPIVSQREAVSLGVNAAILSSNAHEGAMLGAMKELLNAGVAVTGLYDVGWTTGTVAAAR